MARVGIVVGLALEARLLRPLQPRAHVAVGAATLEGTEAALDRLVGSGVSALLSFGLAAGLDPALEPGDLLVPEAVLVDGAYRRADPGLRRWLGPGLQTPLLHSDRLVAHPHAKRQLFADTGCGILDMESGAVARAAARHGLPFAVLRAVCDPAGRVLPPAAALPLTRDGRVQGGKLAFSLLRHPGQLPDLIRLGRDASRARAALAERVGEIAARAA